MTVVDRLVAAFEVAVAAGQPQDVDPGAVEGGRGGAALGLPKTAFPGPLTWVQAAVSVLPSGRPSSVTVPLSVTTALPVSPEL